MSLVSMRQLLDHAAENGYGIPAFNVNNLEQVQAVMAARKYAGEAFIKHLIQAAVEAYPHIPLVMHQDHGQTPAICQGAINLGFGSVMMDGSLREDGKTPADFAYNVDVTRKVVDMAHAVGVTVEGELGCLGSLETGEAGEEDGIGAVGKLDHSQMLTDPEEAARRALRMVLEGKVEALDGGEVAVRADTLCIHGDNPNAPEVARAVREALEQAGVEVRAF